MLMHLFPHELHVGEVFFSPILLDAVLGLAIAWLTGRLLNRFRLSRDFYETCVRVDVLLLFPGNLSKRVFSGWSEVA